MPYALFLASCSMGSPIFLIVPLPYISLCLCVSAYPLPLPLSLGLCSLSLYLGYFLIELWDSLSVYAHSGIACLASQASDWLVGVLNYLVSTSWLINCALAQEPQILEVFKNTLPTKLYWILFTIEDLRQAVDTVKRILTTEKLDKQLTGQTSTRHFMSVREGTDRRVPFNTRDELGDKIDKLTVVMSKLAVKDSHERKPFKPQIYKSRGQKRSHGQAGYQGRSDNGNRRESVNNNARQNYRGIKFRGNFRGYNRQNSRESYRNERYSNNNRDRNRSREIVLTRSYGRDSSL